MEHVIKELITHYFDEAIENIESVPFGLTNYSQVLTVNNIKYIARIYDSHSKDLEKLKFEIELTSFLEGCNLSFKLPVFLVIKTGERYVLLSNGQFGSMMDYIEGEVPELSRISDIRAYGKTVGEISAAFKGFKSKLTIKELSFHKIFTIHPLANEKSVNEFIDRPPFEIDRNQLFVFKNFIQEIRKNEPIIDGLPKQIIHHDLLIFNLLIDSSTRRMNGVLDFDFASNDIRVLELAICINHLLQFQDTSLAYVKIFLDEYSQFMTLTDEELNWIPFLMQMYYVSLMCIYIGQYYSGRELEGHFRFILNQLAVRKHWLEQHEDELMEVFRAKLA